MTLFIFEKLVISTPIKRKSSIHIESLMLLKTRFLSQKFQTVLHMKHKRFEYPHIFRSYVVSEKFHNSKSKSIFLISQSYLDCIFFSAISKSSWLISSGTYLNFTPFLLSSSRIGNIGSPSQHHTSKTFIFSLFSKDFKKSLILFERRTFSVRLIHHHDLFFAIFSRFFDPSHKYANFNGISPLH